MAFLMQFEERDFLFFSFLSCFYVYPAAGTKNAVVSQFPVTERGIFLSIEETFLCTPFKFYVSLHFFSLESILGTGPGGPRAVLLDGRHLPMSKYVQTSTGPCTASNECRSFLSGVRRPELVVDH